MLQDFLFYYLYQQAQCNTVGPSGTCTSHSAAPGVSHGEGQPTESGMYNGFSKVRYIFISVSQDFSFFFFAVLKIFHINTKHMNDMIKELGSSNTRAGFFQSTDNSYHSVT